MESAVQYSGWHSGLAHDVCVFESSQLEGSHIRDFLYVTWPLSVCSSPAVSFQSRLTEITVRKAPVASVPWAVSFGMSTV